MRYFRKEEIEGLHKPPGAFGSARDWQSFQQVRGNLTFLYLRKTASPLCRFYFQSHRKHAGKLSPAFNQPAWLKSNAPHPVLEDVGPLLQPVESDTSPTERPVILPFDPDDLDERAQLRLGLGVAYQGEEIRMTTGCIGLALRFRSVQSTPEE